jgi:hypothetical protein
MDRAIALEYAFEGAWRKLSLSGNESFGLDKDFYERWRPEGLAPALFLNATDVDHGVRILVSQIKWPHALVKPRIKNILLFRPDLQLATSTAVSLSARFPYVTPPANLIWYTEPEVLELLDGGFLDNSGVGIARELRSDLGRFLKNFDEFKADVAFHLIEFTSNGIHRVVSNRGHFEFFAPLFALNSVRLARPDELWGGPDLHSIYLADGWFEPSLNWMLKKHDKREIERRSGGKRDASDEVCCLVKGEEDDWEEMDEKELALYEAEHKNVKKKRIVPNETAFRSLIDLMEKGGDRVVKPLIKK